MREAHVWRAEEPSNGMSHYVCKFCDLTYLRGERCGELTRYWITADGKVTKHVERHHHKSPTIPCRPQ